MRRFGRKLTGQNTQPHQGKETSDENGEIGSVDTERSSNDDRKRQMGVGPDATIEGQDD